MNALGESFPSYLEDDVPQIMNEYNAVIDAYASPTIANAFQD